MSQTSKTIQIVLPSGKPHGIRIAEITTNILQVIELCLHRERPFFHRA